MTVTTENITNNTIKQHTYIAKIQYIINQANMLVAIPILLKLFCCIGSVYALYMKRCELSC